MKKEVKDQNYAMQKEIAKNQIWNLLKHLSGKRAPHVMAFLSQHEENEDSNIGHTVQKEKINANNMFLSNIIEKMEKTKFFRLS